MLDRRTWKTVSSERPWIRWRLTWTPHPGPQQRYQAAPLGIWLYFWKQRSTDHCHRRAYIETLLRRRTRGLILERHFLNHGHEPWESWSSWCPLDEYGKMRVFTSQMTIDFKESDQVSSKWNRNPSCREFLEMSSCVCIETIVSKIQFLDWGQVRDGVEEEGACV